MSGERHEQTSNRPSPIIRIGPEVVELEVDTSKERRIKITYKDKRGDKFERQFTISHRGRLSYS